MITISMLIMAYAQYAMTRKIGYKGWEFFVPGYNIWLLAENITGKGTNCLWPPLIIVLSPLVSALATAVGGMGMLFLIPFIPLIMSGIMSLVYIIWIIKFMSKIARAYRVKPLWAVLTFGITVIIRVFQEAPNCNDMVNQFVTKLFTLDGKSYSEPAPVRTSAPQQRPAPASEPQATPKQSPAPQADNRAIQIAKLNQLLNQGTISSEEYRELIKRL